jgi:hypothetical protein
LEAFLAKNDRSHPDLQRLRSATPAGEGRSAAPPHLDHAEKARYDVAVELITQDPNLASAVSTSRPLHELGQELWESTKLSYEQIVALSDYSYWSKGETPPAQSRLSLDRFLRRLYAAWRQGDVVQEHGKERPVFWNPVTNSRTLGTYRMYSAVEVSHLLPGSTPDERDELTAKLHEAAFAIVKGRPNGSQVADLQFRQSYQKDVAFEDPLDEPLSEARFIHFYRTGMNSAVSTKRISINASRELGDSLMKSLVDHVKDNPDEFPGIRGGKIGNPRWERPDSIIMSLTDDAAVAKVIDWLKTYQETGNGRDAFHWEPPPMTRQVLAGVGIGDAPPISHKHESFGEYRVNPIDEAVVKLPRDGSVTKDQFVAAALEALGGRIDLGEPHLNKPVGSPASSAPADVPSAAPAPPGGGHGTYLVTVAERVKLAQLSRKRKDRDWPDRG